MTGGFRIYGVYAMNDATMFRYLTILSSYLVILQLTILNNHSVCWKLYSCLIRLILEIYFNFRTVIMSKLLK